MSKPKPPIAAAAPPTPAAAAEPAVVLVPGRLGSPSSIPWILPPLRRLYHLSSTKARRRTTVSPATPPTTPPTTVGVGTEEPLESALEVRLPLGEVPVASGDPL